MENHAICCIYLFLLHVSVEWYIYVTDHFESYLEYNLYLTFDAWQMVNSIDLDLHRVRTGPGKPGKSWNFVMAFSRTGKSWKKASGPGKSWKSV